MSGTEFLFDHDAQQMQIMRQRSPDQPGSDTSIVVAVDVSRGSHPCPSEGIDGIGCGGRSNGGIQALAVDYIHRTVEQARDIDLEAGIVPNPYRGFWVEVEHDVHIAVGPIITTRARAEDGGMQNAPRTERRLMIS